MSDLKFSPIFSRCSARELVAYHEPSDCVVSVPARGAIKIHLVDAGVTLEVRDLKGETRKLVEQAKRVTEVKFDEVSRLFRTYRRLDLAAIIDFYIDLKDLICDHYSIYWFEGEPMVMDRRTYDEWVDRNFAHGVEPSAADDAPPPPSAIIH